MLYISYTWEKKVQIDRNCTKESTDKTGVLEFMFGEEIWKWTRNLFIFPCKQISSIFHNIFEIYLNLFGIYPDFTGIILIYKREVQVKLGSIKFKMPLFTFTQVFSYRFFMRRNNRF